MLTSESNPFVAPPGAKVPHLLQMQSPQIIQGALESLVPLSPSSRRHVCMQSHSSTPAPLMSTDNTLPTPHVPSMPLFPSSSSNGTCSTMLVPPSNSNGTIVAPAGAAALTVQPTLSVPTVTHWDPQGVYGGGFHPNGNFIEPLHVFGGALGLSRIHWSPLLMDITCVSPEP